MNAADIRDYVAGQLQDAIAGWREKYPDVDADWEVLHAHPARLLIGASARADLVVLGRHMTGRAIGSVIHPVVSHGPVAVVPSE